MSYLPITLNHMRAVKAWADSAQAQVNLNVRDFNLEVKHRNRYYTLKPRFLISTEGKMGYTTALGNDVTGFIGWLPYDVLQWDLSKDKLLFKQFLEKAEQKFPASWNSIAQASGDFLVKGAKGSFGYQISGPFRAGTVVSAIGGGSNDTAPQSTDFAECFIRGTNLKVWFWGQKAFYAHFHAYPVVVGDGVSTVKELVESRLKDVGQAFTGQGDQKTLIDCLDFQGVTLSDRPAAGQMVWIDFRYGRRYISMTSRAVSDNDLGQISSQVKNQIDAMGRAMATEVQSRFNAPVLYAVDGVVDESGAVFWLEVNSNPILPPEGYTEVFRSLFGPGETP